MRTKVILICEECVSRNYTEQSKKEVHKIRETIKKGSPQKTQNKQKD